MLIALPWRCVCCVDGVKKGAVYTSNGSKLDAATVIVAALSKLNDADVSKILIESKIDADIAKQMFPGVFSLLG